MARYQLPPDPRDRAARSKGRKQPAENGEPVPWRWLGLGIVVTIVGAGLALGLLNAFLSREPLPVTPLSPTLIVLTAPPSPMPTQTPVMPTPILLPTVTAIPTPDPAVAPAEVTPGFYARVANTEGFGVTIRGGPSTSNVAITVAQEDTVMLVLDGPAEGNGFLWWRVRLADGTEGWAAAEFLAPSEAPDS